MAGGLSGKNYLPVVLVSYKAMVSKPVSSNSLVTIKSTFQVTNRGRKKLCVEVAIFTEFIYLVLSNIWPIY